MNYYSGSRLKDHYKKETIVQVDAREAIFGMSLNSNFDQQNIKSEESLFLEKVVQTKYGFII